MNKRYSALHIIAIVVAVAIIFTACKKINEATDIGGGLIPPVDNINTFDTLIRLQTFNDTFGLENDSTRLSQLDEHFLGRISNDPFFGKTDAKLFLELKPATYPYGFLDKRDSVFIDSVVLVLDYFETYGDTLAQQTVRVFELDQVPANDAFRADSFLLIRKNSLVYAGAALGSKTFIPASLKDSVKAYKDTTRNQLRIRLNDNFGQRLLDYDSTSHPVFGAYKSDSLFRTKFKGFALESTTGNAVMGFNLGGANTKLAIYYKYYNTKPKLDTAVAYFNFTTFSASANYVVRDYTGTPLLASLNNGNLPDDVLYLQNTPGTFARIKMPDLALVNNRVIHRAELIVEQIYDISDSTFRAPDFLYLDAFDPSINSGPKFRTIPYDVTFNNSGSLDITSLGSIPIITTDAFGNRIRTWKFNISRYVQHVLTGTQSLYDLRLFPGFRFVEQFGIPPGADSPISVFVNSTILKGRIRVGGGDHPTQKMKLRLIFSKL